MVAIKEARAISIFGKISSRSHSRSLACSLSLSLSLSFSLAIIDNIHRYGYYIDRHRVCAYIKVSRHSEVCANTAGGGQLGIPRRSCVQKSLTITIEART